LLSGDGLAGLGFGLVPVPAFGVWGVGAGEQVVGAVYVAGAERLPGLSFRSGGQVPPLEVACGLRQILTFCRTMPEGGRRAIRGALTGRLRGVLDLPLSRLAGRRSEAGRVVRAGMLGFGADLAGLGFSGRPTGGLAGLPVAPRGGPSGGLVGCLADCGCLDLCWAAWLASWAGLPAGFGVDGDAVAGWATNAEASGMQGVGVASEHLLGPC
jgi:hypothetical protein